MSYATMLEKEGKPGMHRNLETWGENLRRKGDSPELRDYRFSSLGARVGEIARQPRRTAARKFVTKMKRNNPLSTIPTSAFARMPFVPYLRIPNRATTPSIQANDYAHEGNQITLSPLCPFLISSSLPDYLHPCSAGSNHEKRKLLTAGNWARNKLNNGTAVNPARRIQKSSPSSPGVVSVMWLRVESRCI
jgi:hypothetical protein